MLLQDEIEDHKHFDIEKPVVEDETPIAPVVELVVEAPVSNVVSLFARQEVQVVDTDDEDLDDGDDVNDPPLVIVEPRARVAVPPADDIFAKLRRSGADSVAKEVAESAETIENSKDVNELQGAALLARELGAKVIGEYPSK